MKATTSFLIVAIALLFSSCALDTSSALKKISNSNIENKPYADENKDWKIHPVRNYKSANYHSPTPISHPTAEVITTYELSKMITSGSNLVVVSVNGGKNNSSNSIPNSVWLKGFGLGPTKFDALDLQRFSQALSEVTHNDKNTPLIFYCFDSHCWLSYNSSLRAAELGYTHIYWYRGGIIAWKSAGLPLVPIDIYGN
jgi:PQQ-dependent catabolism-associated CXXCW motif protein